MNSFSVAPVTPVVKKLLIANIAIWFLIQIILDRFFGFQGWRNLILVPELVIEKFYIWQLVTYMFFHAVSPTHILFNMLMLWFFGSELEKTWGSKFFTIYYFFTGTAAAVIYCLVVGIYSASTGFRPVLVTPVMGASGALFGLLIAYGILFSERVIYFMGLFPLKAKYFVIIAGAVDMASLITTGFSGSDVAYLAHLGGLVSGFLFLKGHVYYKRNMVASKLKRKSSNLRLVVDNEKPKSNENPKYWN